MLLPTNHRKEVIEDLLDIGIFSIMGSLLKDKASENRKQLSETGNQIMLLDILFYEEIGRYIHPGFLHQ